MAKLKTERIRFDGAVKGELDFNIEINVAQDGSFTTTLPSDIASAFQAAGIDLTTNGRSNGKYGFYCGATLNDLLTHVKRDAQDYLSRELSFEKVVLKYVIQTACSYMIDERGNIVPNGYWMDDYEKNGKWREGTIPTNATNRSAYGFQVFVEPMVKKEYKYKSGKTKTEYAKLCYAGPKYQDKNLEENLRFLDDLCGMALPDKSEWNGQLQEMDYDENVAALFVSLIKGICAMNEKIKDFVSPKAIKMLADQKKMLLN